MMATRHAKDIAEGDEAAVGRWADLASHSLPLTWGWVLRGVVGATREIPNRQRWRCPRVKIQEATKKTGLTHGRQGGADGNARVSGWKGTHMNDKRDIA